MERPTAVVRETPGPFLADPRAALYFAAVHTTSPSPGARTPWIWYENLPVFKYEIHYILKIWKSTRRSLYGKQCPSSIHIIRRPPKYLKTGCFPGRKPTGRKNLLVDPRTAATRRSNDVDIVVFGFATSRADRMSAAVIPSILYEQRLQCARGTNTSDTHLPVLFVNTSNATLFQFLVRCLMTRRRGWPSTVHTDVVYRLICGVGPGVSYKLSSSSYKSHCISFSKRPVVT